MVLLPRTSVVSPSQPGAVAGIFRCGWISADGFDFVLIALVLTEVQSEFGLTTFAGGKPDFCGFYLSRWFGGLLLGAMGDRYGRRLAMVSSIILFSVEHGMRVLRPVTTMFIARLW